uniref:Uncharacterized protein n=1 Tax=Panagrolaimus davidi TaxID=227884 RepID=A0A914R2U4_9BILA
MEKKKCADGTCYAFYCIGPDGKVMEGIGCYEDFRGACSSLSAEVLEKAKGEKEYQYYYDENVMVVSCGYADVGIDCAYAELYRYKHQAIVDQTFGKNHTKLSGSKQCTYTTEVHGSATEPDKASNSNDVKLSGMFILGFVLFYLW